MVHINHRLSVSSNLGKLNLCSEKGIAVTCTNMCIGANTGASGECIACMSRCGEKVRCMKNWILDAVSGTHGEFHLP